MGLLIALMTLIAAIIAVKWLNALKEEVGHRSGKR